MKLGFLTVCLKTIDLKELVKWASESQFQSLEVACWPVNSDRDYAGSSINVIKLNEKGAKEIKKIFKDYNISISSLAYYDNNLTHDLNRRKENHEHLKKVIIAAEMLEVEQVGTFIGRNIEKTEEENWKIYEEVFPDIIKFAEKHNVKIIIENCPMVGWQREKTIGNLAYSPENWEKMFKIIPSKNFGLNLDPSHLYWLGIDYIQVIKDFKERIFHAHAKDTEIFKDKLMKNSILGRGWWRYRMPGLGEIDWKKFITTLKDNGYDGVLSIEHEDPVWYGDEDKVKRGLIFSRKYLSDFIVE
jgi:sugar phosphate isomerase/epimerase